MTRPHPFEWISEQSRTRVFVVVALLTIALLISLLALDVPLRTDVAPAGIVSFELAGDMPTAQAILDSWGSEGRVYAGVSLGLDYLFLFSYVIAVGLGCVLIVQRLPQKSGFLVALGLWAAWGMVAAGLFDFIENYGLIRLLINQGKPWWPSIVYWSAVLKYLLVGIALVYLVVGFIVQFVRGNKSTS